METTPLNVFIYTQVTPDQVRHTLTDDGWSSFDFGPLRLQIPTADLTRVNAAADLADVIQAQAGFWGSDLREIRDRLKAAEDARTMPPEPRPDPAAVPDSAPDEPYGGDDPALDAAVEKVATRPETRRKPTLKDEK